jgi:hypothetical protein
LTSNSTAGEPLVNIEAVSVPAPTSGSAASALATDPAVSGELAHARLLSQPPPPAQAPTWSPMLESYECMVELVGAHAVDRVVFGARMRATVIVEPRLISQ